MLGNSKNNKWCCFCKYWYDPTNSALKPRMGANFFDVDTKIIKKCTKCNLKTRATAVCGKFESKF